MTAPEDTAAICNGWRERTQGESPGCVGKRILNPFSIRLNDKRRRGLATPSTENADLRVC